MKRILLATVILIGCTVTSTDNQNNIAPAPATIQQDDTYIARNHEDKRKIVVVPNEFLSIRSPRLK